MNRRKIRIRQHVLNLCVCTTFGLAVAAGPACADVGAHGMDASRVHEYERTHERTMERVGRVDNERAAREREAKARAAKERAAQAAAAAAERDRLQRIDKPLQDDQIGNAILGGLAGGAVVGGIGGGAAGAAAGAATRSATSPAVASAIEIVKQWVKELWERQTKK